MAWEDKMRSLLEQRDSKVEEAREAYERAEREGAEDSGEARESWDRAMNDVASLDKRISEVQTLLDSERVADEAREQMEDVVRPKGSQRDRGDNGEDEFRAFFAGERGNRKEFRFEARDLSTDGTQGESNTLDRTFVRSLYQGLRELTLVRRMGARVIVTQNGEEFTQPRVSAHTPDSEIVAEGGTFTKKEPSFDQVSFGAYKWGHITMLSYELAVDNAVNLVDFLVDDSRVALAQGQNKAFLLGSGTNEPEGIVPATTQVHTAPMNDLTPDDLIDLDHALSEPYREGAVFVLNDASLKAVRKLKDANGDYLWQRGLTDGAPSSILGRRYIVEPNMADIGSGTRSVLLFNGRGYWIRDVGSVRVKRSEEYGYDTDEIAWRFAIRGDGGLVDANTSAVIEHATA